MDNQLTTLMSKVAIKDNLAIYRDEERGFILPYQKEALYASSKSVLLTDEIINKMIEDKVIAKDYVFEKGEVQITKEVSKEKANTIIDVEVQTYFAWEVKNALGVQYFNNKEEAISLADKINIALGV